ncbi:thioredoxin family protein, partial [Thiolapillus sp.]
MSTGLVNPGYHEKPAWFKESFLDLREDVKEAAAGNKRVMLYFYQDGCPYCARLLKDNFGNPEIAEKTRRHFDVIAINLWGDREVTDLQGKITTEKRFAESLKVQYTPTLLFLDEQGKVVARLNGYYEPDKFSIVLDYVAGKHESEMKLSAYYRQRLAGKAQGRLNSEPFFLPHPLKLADNRRQSWRPLLVLFEQSDCK